MLDFILEVVVDGAGIISYFELSYSWNSKKFVLIKDVTKIFRVHWFIIVPSLPVQSIIQYILAKL